MIVGLGIVAGYGLTTAIVYAVERHKLAVRRERYGHHDDP